MRQDETRTLSVSCGLLSCSALLGGCWCSFILCCHYYCCFFVGVVASFLLDLLLLFLLFLLLWYNSTFKFMADVVVDENDPNLGISLTFSTSFGIFIGQRTVGECEP